MKFRINFEYIYDGEQSFHRDFNIFSIENDINLEFNTLQDFLSYCNIIKDITNDCITLYGENFHIKHKDICIDNNGHTYTITLIFHDEKMINDRESEYKSRLNSARYYNII